MRVASIEEEGMERVFWNHANRDPLDYYFFILDLKQSREQTKILLAIEEEEVQGLMLVYADCIVQLRGSRKAVELLLQHVDLEEVELQSPPDCEDIVLRKYKPQVKHELVIMCLKKGEETLHIKHTPVRLGVDDAEEVAAIMKEADPEWWGEITAERQKERLKNGFWLGMKEDQRLVSLGSTNFVDFASNVGVMATDQRYRNMGYATSILSGLVQEILKRSPAALIHVLKNNAPAVHVYSKVGFTPYKYYLLMRAERVKP